MKINHTGEDALKIKNVKNLKALKENKNHQHLAAKKVSDKVNLSQKANLFKRIKDRLNKIPEIRIEKVEKIKKALQEKTYQVKSEKVAESIIKESLFNKLSINKMEEKGKNKNE